MNARSRTFCNDFVPLSIWAAAFLFYRPAGPYLHSKGGDNYANCCKTDNDQFISRGTG